MTLIIHSIFLIFRKVQNESSTGSTSSSRIRTKLTICVENIDFDTQACVLRLKGRNIEENQYVKVHFQIKYDGQIVCFRSSPAFYWVRLLAGEGKIYKIKNKNKLNNIYSYYKNLIISNNPFENENFLEGTIFSVGILLKFSN